MLWKGYLGHFLFRSEIRLYFDNMVLFWWFIEIISILQHWYCISIEKEKIKIDSTVLIIFFISNSILLQWYFVIMLVYRDRIIEVFLTPI